MFTLRGLLRLTRITIMDKLADIRKQVTLLQLNRYPSFSSQRALSIPTYISLILSPPGTSMTYIKIWKTIDRTRSKIGSRSRWRKRSGFNHLRFSTRSSRDWTSSSRTKTYNPPRVPADPRDLLCPLSPLKYHERPIRKISSQRSTGNLAVSTMSAWSRHAGSGSTRPTGV